RDAALTLLARLASWLKSVWPMLMRVPMVVIASSNPLIAASCALRPMAMPLCGPRPAKVSAFSLVPSCRCRSSSWLRMLRSDWMTGERLLETPEIVKATSCLEQRVEHLLDCSQHAGIRRIGALQRDQPRHLGVDVDRRGVVEALLQGVDHHVLPLLEV